MQYYYTQLLATKHSPECLMTVVNSITIKTFTASVVPKENSDFMLVTWKGNKLLLWVCNIPVTQDARSDHVQFMFKLSSPYIGFNSFNFILEE